MNQKKKCPVIVICLLFAFWFFIIPLIMGAILYIRNLKIDKEARETADDELTKLKSDSSRLRAEISELENEKNKALSERDTLIDSYRREAHESIANRFQQLEQEISQKEAAAAELDSKCEKTKKDIESNEVKVFRLKEVYKSFQHAIKAYESGSDSHLDEALLAMADNTLDPIVELRFNCLNVKQLRSRYNQVQRDIQEAFKRYEGRYNTKGNIALYKLMVIALEAELQNVLFSLKYGKLDDSVEAVREITARYLTIATDGNQSIAPTMKKFIGEIEYLFIEAVKIEYEYYTQKERIKEEQRAIKEQMKQEAEERKALELERKKIEQEEDKYINEMKSVNEQIESCSDPDQIQKLNERIAQLHAQLSAVNDKKDEIAKLQNGKAGYVYVISNLGSFGDDVFKVGMTRRLDPMDRIKELSSASVPFSFDVHSLIFSDNAVDLETTLHHELNNKRVNKINLRKEFFKVSLDELEELVYAHDPTAEFNRTMLAEEYNQGMSMTDEPIELAEDVTDSEDEQIKKSPAGAGNITRKEPYNEPDKIPLLRGSKQGNGSR